VTRCNWCGAALVAVEQFDAGLCGTCGVDTRRRAVTVGAVVVVPRVQFHGASEVPGWRASVRGQLGPFATTPEAAAAAVRA
jgi:hypothetical protein